MTCLSVGRNEERAPSLSSTGSLGPFLPRFHGVSISMSKRAAIPVFDF